MSIDWVLHGAKIETTKIILPGPSSLEPSDMIVTKEKTFALVTTLIIICKDLGVSKTQSIYEIARSWHYCVRISNAA